MKIIIEPKRSFIVAVIIAIVFVLAILGATNYPAKSLALTYSEQQQKIDYGFNQLRLANNNIEAGAIEAQLVLDLSQAKLASSNLLFESAQKIAEKGDFARALQLYQAIQKNEPDFAEAYVNAAYMAFELGDKEMALSMLRRAVKLEPRHFAAWFGLGTLLDEKSDIKDAQAAYENSLYNNPNFDAAKRALFAIEAKTRGISL